MILILGFHGDKGRREVMLILPSPYRDEVGMEVGVHVVVSG